MVIKKEVEEQMIGNFLTMLLGLISVSREKKDLILKLIQDNNDVKRKEFACFMNDVMERGEGEKANLLLKLAEGVETLRKTIVTKQEIDELERKIDRLNKELQSI
jgi:polyhydroxyalkanoate synthesis regulator phasin